MRPMSVFRCAASLSIAVAACGGSSGGPSNGASASSDGGPGGGFQKDGAGDANPGEGGNPSGGDDAGNPSGGDDAANAADGAGLVNPHPTISSWLGTNIAADLPRVDITPQLNPFDTPAAQLDANGYPAGGASGSSSTDLGFVLPTGTYKISYRGSGTLAVSGIGKLGGAWQTVNGEQRNIEV